MTPTRQAAVGWSTMRGRFCTAVWSRRRESPSHAASSLFSSSPSHSRMSSAPMRVVKTDVFLVGSGPASCTYARTLLESTSQRLFMAEMGSQQSSILGENLKNAAYFQHNIAAFQHVIVGHLHPLEPGNTSLPGASATYAVGGMASHWTCATPRPHADELPETYSKTEWDRLYTASEELLGTNLTPFDGLIS